MQLTAANMSRMKLTADEKEALNGWVVASSTNGGSYGGGTDSWAFLSHAFDVPIIYMDLSEPSKFTCFKGNSKGTFEAFGADAVVAHVQFLRNNSTPFIAVEFNGKHGVGARGSGAGHFAGYLAVPGCEPEVPRWLRTQLQGS